MKFELEPMSFGEVLDGAIKVFRSNLMLFLSIQALFTLPPYLISSWMGHMLGSLNLAQPSARLQPAFFRAGLANLLIYVFFISAWAMMTTAAVQTVIGEPASVRKALSRCLRIFWPILGATLIAVIVSGLWGLLLLFPGVVYFLRRSLYLAVLLVEGGTAGNALTRSKVLVMGKTGKGRLDRVFGATVVFGVLTWVVTFGLGMLIPAGLKGTIVGAVMSATPQIIIGPLLPISLVLIYFDARVRDEGYDLELRAQAAGATLAPPAASLAGAAVPSGPA